MPVYKGLLAPQPNQPIGGLLDPKTARMDAFLAGLGSMGSHLIAAGSASTDPGNFGRGIAKAGQAFGQSHRGSLANSQNMAMQNMQGQGIQLQIAAQQKALKDQAQRELARDRYINKVTMPNGPTQAAAQAQDTSMGLLAKANPDAFVASQVKAMTPDYITAGDNIYKTQGGKVHHVAGQGKAPATGMVPDGQGGWKMDPRYEAFQINKTRAGKPDPIQVNTGKKLEEALIDRLTNERDQAMDAVATVGRLNDMSAALKNANVGPGSTIAQGWDRVSMMMGVGGKDAAERLVNTQTLVKGLAEMTLSSRGLLKGQGTVTDTETLLLEKAKSGNISELTAPELAVIMDASARAAQARHSNYIDMLERSKEVDGLSKFTPFYSVPELPEYKPTATTQPSAGDFSLEELLAEQARREAAKSGLPDPAGRGNGSLKF